MPKDTENINTGWTTELFSVRLLKSLTAFHPIGSGHSSMSSSRTSPRLALLVNSFIPLAFATSALQRAVRRYFVRSFALCMLIGLSYLLAVTTFHFDIRLGWLLCLMIFVWFPLAYSMSTNFASFQASRQSIGPHEKSWPMLCGGAGTLGAIGILSVLDNGHPHPEILALAIPAVAYLSSLWNVGWLYFLIDRHMLEKGGPLALGVAIAAGAFWAWLD